MVINGKTITKKDFSVLALDGERIYLPRHIVERVAFAGTDEVEAMLLVLSPGRYRLIRPTTNTVDADLDRVTNGWEAAALRGTMLDYENNARAAIRGRLISCSISPPPPGWRINFTKEAVELAPGDRSHVFFLFVAGFVEFWFPDALRAALSVPLSETLT